MALDKNKTGIMAAISAATEGPAPIGKRAVRSLPRGTVGSVRAGLGGVQEIDTALIVPWGPQDRLELTAVNSDADTGDVHDLAESISTSGQHVPVLLRPSPDRDGKFEVIYGRRRILACQQLGIPVKALIRTLDDTEAMMAKGLENASRVGLSFYERARFAVAILEQGFSRDEAMQALAISKHSLSQLERIARLIPDEVGDAIGAAPGAGRPKWTVLATAFESGALNASQVLQAVAALPTDTLSDDRFQAVLDLATKRGRPETTAAKQMPLPGMIVKSGQSSVSMTIKRSGEGKAFADWFEQHGVKLIEDSYQAFTKNGPEDVSAG